MNQTRAYTSPPLLVLSFATLLFAATVPYSAFSAEKTAVSEVKVLGLDLLETDPKKVRKQLSNLGGFLQSKGTVNQNNLDKYFPWSIDRDSYYYLFRFNHAGKVTSVKRLYRPYSLEQVNKRTPIETRDVASDLIRKLGQPTFVTSKGWGGTQNYRAYTWQDDKMTITIDREGSESLGNVYIKYTVNIHDPYEVEDKGDA